MSSALLRLRSAAIGAALVGLASGPAMAQGAGTDFAVTDGNGDGQIQRFEYDKRMAEIFFFADRNHDGVIVVEELDPVDRPAFTIVDVDGNGVISLSEFLAYRGRDFTAADRNHDGGLSSEEAAGYRP